MILDERSTLKNHASLYAKFGPDLLKVREEMGQLYRRVGYSPLHYFMISRNDNFPFENYKSYRLVQKIARKAMRPFFKTPTNFINPQLTDVEAEMTYLLIRERRPETIVEISPCGGWSTNWILRALRDNGQGELHSYDLIDLSRRFIAPDLSQRWTLHIGDAKMATLPNRIDYLFLDSDHSAGFAQWYIKTLFPTLTKGTMISVHDIVSRVGGEAEVIRQYLASHNIPYVADNEAIGRARKALGIRGTMHYAQHSSMIWWESE